MSMIRLDPILAVRRLIGGKRPDKRHTESLLALVLPGRLGVGHSSRLVVATSPVLFAPSVRSAPVESMATGGTQGRGHPPRAGRSQPDVPPRESSLPVSSVLASSSLPESSEHDDNDGRGAHALLSQNRDDSGTNSLPRPSQVAINLHDLRRTLVDGIVAESQRETRQGPRLTAEGKAVFQQAGFEDRIDQRGDIEVRTRWLKPVIQETVIRKEHTEYLTQVTRDVHRHHIYPVVQPIHDPDPLVLPPRHRIFSSIDNQWHEFVGDEAAIAILGEDVFHNGPQQVRHERVLISPEEEERIKRSLLAGQDAHSRARVIEREGEELEGAAHGDWRLVGRKGSESKPFNDRDFKDGLDDLEGEMRTLHMTL